jgi:hypothetical protein
VVILVLRQGLLFVMVEELEGDLSLVQLVRSQDFRSVLQEVVEEAA